MTKTPRILYSVVALTGFSWAQSSCATSVSTSVPEPSLAPGYEARIVATGLKNPRGIIFDQQGNLLVVEKQTGVTALTLNDAGGSCLSEQQRRTVVNDNTLNHGIELSSDGKTLYASSAEAVFSYPYDPQNAQITANGTTLVSNMTTDDHTTRTLLLSRKQNGTLIVTRGSTSNIDPEAADQSSGHSQVKAFTLTNLTGKPYDFNNNGRLLGWGLRNDVGIAEEPSQGGLYSVENSADQLNRSGTDIHQNNPAEELNFLGYLQPPYGTVQSKNQGANFGYPECFTAWEPSSLPNFNGTVGTQFAVNDLNSTNNDDICSSEFAPPELAFQAHMAPLDIKFNTAGTEAWITFHGSWDRTEPTGYKVGAVQFSSGRPAESSTSTTALTDIVANQNNTNCPDECFRPVGLAWDKSGRLYFSSDATGEIYVITKAGASGADAGVDGTTPAPTTSSTAPSTPSASPTGAASSQVIAPSSLIWLLVLTTGVVLTMHW